MAEETRRKLTCELLCYIHVKDPDGRAQHVGDLVYGDRAQPELLAENAAPPMSECVVCMC